MQNRACQLCKWTKVEMGKMQEVGAGDGDIKHWDALLELPQRILNYPIKNIFICQEARQKFVHFPVPFSLNTLMYCKKLWDLDKSVIINGLHFIPQQYFYRYSNQLIFHSSSGNEYRMELHFNLDEGKACSNKSTGSPCLAAASFSDHLQL